MPEKIDEASHPLLAGEGYAVEMKSSFSPTSTTSDLHHGHGHAAWASHPNSASSKKRSKSWLVCLVAAASTASTAILIVFVLVVFQNNVLEQLGNYRKTKAASSGHSEDAALSPLTGRTYSQDFLAFANDVLLTVKTGGAVFYQRLPIHLLDEESSLRLISKTMYFADFEADIQDLHVYDALSNMSAAVHQQGQFQPYFALQDRIHNGEPMTGSPDGWQLDKYKFLPLHGIAYREYPDVKFSIHIEADTYLVQEGLLRWLYTLNPDDQIVAGAVALINDHAFAHGGSGYVLSRGLLNATWGQDKYLEAKYDKMVDNECCGDYILSEVFRELKPKGVDVDGVNIDCEHRFQGNPPMLIDFHRDNICHAIFTFHHVTAEDSHGLFQFEKEMYSKMQANDFIRYIDVYDHFMPSFLRNKHAGMTTRLDWDNNAQDREVPMLDDMKYTMNAHLCASECNEWDDCLIWKLSLEEENRQGVPVCKLGDRVIFGTSASGVQSGWMTSRIHTWLGSQECYNRFNREWLPEGWNNTLGIYA